MFAVFGNARGVGAVEQQTKQTRPVALVTGGARGIGAAIAAHLADHFDVAVTWNRTAPALGVTAFEADLTQPGSCTRVIGGVIEKFGRLDVIVNNAGLVANGAVEVVDPATNGQMFALNAEVPARLLAAALPQLKPGASVVSLSSTNAECPQETAVMYGASKAALNAWTKGTAKALGPRGIRVNAVAPGAVNVPDAARPRDDVARYASQIALGRMGTPEDIAKVVGFLASDAAGYITGEVITVSGGWRL